MDDSQHTDDDDGILNVDTMSSPTIDNLQDYAHQDPEFGNGITPPGQVPARAAKTPHASKPSDVLGENG